MGFNQEWDVDLIFEQGEPFAGASMYAQNKIYQEVKKSGVRVILDGQGADELFAGYDGYEMDLIDSFLEVGSYKQLLLFLARWSVGENRGLLRGSKSFTACMLKKYAPRFYRGLFDRKHTPPEWINSDYFEQKSSKS